MPRTIRPHLPANPTDLLIDLGEQVRRWQEASDLALQRLVASGLAQVQCPTCHRGAVSYENAGEPTIGVCPHLYDELERIGQRQQRTSRPKSPVYYFRIDRQDFGALAST